MDRAFVAVMLLGVTAVAVSISALRFKGAASGDEPQDRQAERERMVEQQVRGRGIHDERVLAVMAKVPRHRFVPADAAAAAYDDRPLPIGHGQTISQPYIVAFMTEALTVGPADDVLEIGTGSGYQAAILAELARAVYSIELVPALAERARRALATEGYRNVQVRAGDGYLGWPDRAPFSKIIVTAAPESVPEALVNQLAVGGTMIVPVGPQMGAQELRILTRTTQGVMTERSLAVRFVPMVRPPGEP